MTAELEPYQATVQAAHTDADFTVSDETRQLILDGIADNTRAAYENQWARFAAWCQTQGRVDLPTTAQTIAEYVQHLAAGGMSPSTISQAIAAVRTVHRHHGFKGQPDSEAAMLALKGYKTQRAEAGHRKKKSAPILLGALQAMVDTIDTATAIGVRDRAILVLCWALMGRRSEVAALMDADVRETSKGITVHIAKSKTDQHAKGEDVPIVAGDHAHTDPVRVVRAWRDVLAEHDACGGRLFRSVDKHGNIRGNLGPATVDRIVKDAVNNAGLPQPELYSAHGLRAGSATAAYKNRTPVSTIARHGRWAENSPVVLGYIREVDKWEDNPMKGIGL